MGRERIERVRDLVWRRFEKIDRIKVHLPVSSRSSTAKRDELDWFRMFSRHHFIEYVLEYSVAYIRGPNKIHKISWAILSLID